MPRIALYPGSFDPPTFGHLDLIGKALGLFDELVVAIGVHPGKTPVFSPEERAELIRGSIAGAGDHERRVRVSYFSDLVTNEAARQGAIALVRGLRDGTDLDYEMQMAGMNGRLAPKLITIFLPPSAEARPITATLVRQIARMGGDVSHFVPPHVASALQHKLAASQSLSGDSR